MKIKEIHIKNFRSIRNMAIQAKNFNVFVGLNDVGKSNILRALNLFFNGQTDNGVPFNFDTDFSYLFPEKSHSTREIKITIKFEVPETYKESGIITWDKTWKRSVTVKESLTNKRGEELPARSRVETALKRIKFRYVPAVKSKDYYKDLLAELYNTISISLNTPLGESTFNFSKALKDNTESLSKNAFQRLGIQSILTIPHDMKEIFKSLIFETKSKDSGITVSLSVRGDGIQARHIPVVLSYIAEEDQKTRNKGSTRVFTIWGYEEPENGLEMTKCFEMADEFIKYSDEIQIFITTHSPAFYMKKNESGANVFFISKDKDNEETKSIITKSNNELDECMGLMPIVAPYIYEQNIKLKKYLNLIEENFLTDIDTIIVEGKTDKKYLEKALEILDPPLYQKIQDNSLRILTKKDSCGVSQLHDWAIAWCYCGFVNKLLILFDKDKAGEETNEKLSKSEIYKIKNSKKKINVQFIQPSDSIVDLLNANIIFPFSIEHLLSISLWKEAKRNNWLVEKEAQELKSMFINVLPIDDSLNNIINNIVTDNDNLSTILTMNVIKGKKEEFCNLAIRKASTEKSIFDGFSRTTSKINNFFI